MDEQQAGLRETIADICAEHIGHWARHAWGLEIADALFTAGLVTDAENIAAVAQIRRMEREGGLTALGAYDMIARIRNGLPLS